MILYSLKLAIVGMFVVFSFLLAMVLIIGGMGKILKSKKNDESEVAAAIAAVHKHRTK